MKKETKNIISVDAMGLQPRDINGLIRSSDGVRITNCFGQRFIGSGMKDKSIEIKGTPGNALGAYLDGASIEVFGNCQEAVGDTMNEGEIIIHGGAGDALGYAMRGGEIYVKDNAGYRAGVHIKQYGDKRPIIVVGGAVGSFLGEYQAGGIIIVLGIGCSDLPYGFFPATGMHGGKIFIRTNKPLSGFSEQVKIRKAEVADLSEIKKYLDKYCKYFKQDKNELGDTDFYVVEPDQNNPYKRLYTVN